MISACRVAAIALVSGLVLLGQGSLAQGTATLDPFFGDGGVAAFDQGGIGSPEALEIDHRGRPLVVGATQGSDCPAVYAARFNGNGTLDKSFGGQGFVTAAHGCEAGKSVVALAGGGVLVAGVNLCEYSSLLNCFLVSYKFRVNGKRSEDWGFSAIQGRRIVRTNSSLIPSDAVQDSSGRILIGGTADHGPNRSGGFVARFKADGSFDKSLSSAEKSRNGLPGMVEFLAPRGSHASVQDLEVYGRKILAAGFLQGKLMIARLSGAGKPDKSFGRNGLYLRDLDGSKNCECTRGFAMTRDKKGRIVVGGADGAFFAFDGSTRYRSFLVRVRPDGTVDHSFGKSGVVFPRLGRSSIQSVAVQSNGRILASGSIGHKSFIARFESNGDPDRTFFDRGVLRLPRSDEANALAIDGQGRIVAVGRSEYSGAQLLRIVDR